MIKVYGGIDDEVNSEVRMWLRYWGFYWYPNSRITRNLKARMGVGRDNLVVIDEVEAGVVGRMMIRDTKRRDKELLYWKFGIPKSAWEEGV